MNEIKAYIVDSHVLVRQMMINIIRTIHEVTPLGATSGEDEEGVIRAVEKLKPDVVLIGIDEPGSEEMALFMKLRQNYPELPVIVITPKSYKGATIAFQALKNGAVEFITTPEKSCQVPLARRHFLKRVVPALRMVHRLNMSGEGYDSENIPSLPKSSSPVVGVELVVIGGDTGGVRSLFKLIAALPEDLPVPIIIVQHLPKYYTRLLAEKLDRLTKLNVFEVNRDSVLRPGQIYLIPGGYHGEVRQEGNSKFLKLHRGLKEHRCRPSLNVLLRSASQIYADKLLAVVLSGGGKDGLTGCRRVLEAGGDLLIESKKSALLWDMPRRLLQSDLPCGIHHIDELGDRIRDHVYGSAHAAMLNIEKSTPSIHP